ncbi:MAG: hypothetical protein AVDCRST_MAG20-910 [uncultured Acidimicrobiales bacterium]|uniref:Uncharacterized protein n=1 Tax=uncultured Acidimicrobiales bacterium TaxID=310071 RepID=A0A6J4HLE6_9ACTN|nr:MAG: hypothetical protein AVDCRST_MAG20-910 [uncultured Acidimicrobiales bacterium]
MVPVSAAATRSPAPRQERGARAERGPSGPAAGQERGA